LGKDRASDDGGKSTPVAKHVHYEWIGSEDTKEYMRSVEKWRAHTNDSSFATEFDTITKLYKDDNELRT
jgi:hypothetical protein